MGIGVPIVADAQMFALLVRPLFVRVLQAMRSLRWIEVFVSGV